MKPSSITPVTVAVAAVGFFIMAALGWNLAALPRAATAPQDAEQNTRSQTRTRPDRRFGPPERVLQQMAKIRNVASPVDRMRATIELANSIPISEIAAWLNGHWFNLPTGCEAAVFNKILSDRWLLEDPEGFALHSLKQENGPSYETFRAWVKKDPHAALDFFKKHPNPSMEMEVLQTIADRDPALALDRLKELLASGASADRGSGLLHQLARSSPAALEALLDSMPHEWRNNAEAALIGLRLKDSFSKEIRSLWERPDGWQIFRRATQYSDGNTGDQLLAELGNLPASWRGKIAEDDSQFFFSESAEKWWGTDLEGMGFTAEQAGKIRLQAVENLLYEKPELALKLFVQTNIPENQRESMIASIFSQADTPEKSDAWLALLGSDADRQIATEFIAKRAAAKTPSDSEIQTPSAWLGLAAASKPGEGMGYSYLLEQWDEKKIAEVATGFRALPDDQKMQVAKILAFNITSNQANPELSSEAIHFLVSHPEPGAPNLGSSSESPVELASTQAVYWAKKDPAAASAWVETLPTGTAQDWARKNLASNWAQYDPDAAGQWISTLPATARTQVNDHLKKNASHGQ